jgi:hypothetical protein
MVRSEGAFCKVCETRAFPAFDLGCRALADLAAYAAKPEREIEEQLEDVMQQATAVVEALSVLRPGGCLCFLLLTCCWCRGQLGSRGMTFNATGGSDWQLNIHRYIWLLGLLCSWVMGLVVVVYKLKSDSSPVTTCYILGGFLAVTLQLVSKAWPVPAHCKYVPP